MPPKNRWKDHVCRPGEVKIVDVDFGAAIKFGYFAGFGAFIIVVAARLGSIFGEWLAERYL